MSIELKNGMILLEKKEPDPRAVMEYLRMLRNQLPSGSRMLIDREMASYAIRHGIPYERVTQDPKPSRLLNKLSLLATKAGSIIRRK